MRQRAELVTSRWGFYFNAGRNIKKNGIASDAYQAGINIKARLARPELRSVADLSGGLWPPYVWLRPPIKAGQAGRWNKKNIKIHLYTKGWNVPDVIP